MKKRTILLCLAALAVLGLLMVPPPALAEDQAVIIGFKEKPGPAEQALIHGMGGKVKRNFKLIRAMSAKVSAEALGKLKKNTKVKYIEDNGAMTAVEPIAGGIEYENSWGVVRIGSDRSHQQNILGTGVRVAILDTGIDYTHPQLAPNYRNGDNFVSLDPNFHDPYDDSYNSHGTHLAGIIGAILDNGGTVGVAPRAELYAAKVLDGAGGGTVESLIAGLEWAVAQQVQIANISIGNSFYYQSLEEACQAAYDAGILLVAAAGNSYGGNVLYPAAFDSVVAVSATTQLDDLAIFSAVGPQVELAAPGAGIYSSVAGGGFEFLSGTSQAAPHVAGAAALALSKGISDLNGDGLADNRDLRLQLQAGAQDLGPSGRDPQTGFGLVNADLPEQPPAEVIHLVVTKEKKAPSDNAVTCALADGVYGFTVVNDNLSNLAVEVYDDTGQFLEELSRSIRFSKKEPAQPTFTLDAGGKALEVVLIPSGKFESSADVFINKQI